MLTHHSLTQEKYSKVKSDTTGRFAGNDFLKVDCTMQISRTNYNKQDRDIFGKGQTQEAATGHMETQPQIVQ